MQTFIRIAKRLPDVEEGIACKGTALESRTFKVNEKAFLFLSARDARLKLGPSVAEAVAFAKAEPSRCTVGAGGWVKLSVAAPPSSNVLARWIAESRATMGTATAATKKSAPRAGKKAAKKATPEKKTKRRQAR
jgi:hypothetical protein